MQEYLNLLPDLHFDVDVMIASGDQVFTRWQVTGTYREELMSRPTSSRKLEEYGCTLSKLGEKGIIHVWHYWDNDHLPPHVAAQ